MPKSNDDVLAVYNSFVYSMLSKDDMTMKIMVHPFDNSDGWNAENQSDQDWSVAAILPDFLYKQRAQPIIHVTEDGTHNVGATRSYTRTDDLLLPTWWPDASYWGAFYIAPPSPY